MLISNIHQYRCGQVEKDIRSPLFGWQRIGSRGGNPTIWDSIGGASAVPGDSALQYPEHQSLEIFKNFEGGIEGFVSNILDGTYQIPRHWLDLKD